ncbi:RNA polymerase sigma factor [Streptomyces klenkii]|uniref:RNA polymerase sigma factor n=1 Tax=Streptomyces klenkii TaxID=1420899 RepID=UPI003F4B5B09
MFPHLRPEPDTSSSRAAFADHYAKDMALLVRFVMRHGAAIHEAADIAHAAFAEAFECWESIEHPRAWLRRVASRRLSRLRNSKEKLTDEIPDMPGGRCPVAAVELGEEEARVYEALDWLPERQKAVMAWTLDGFRPTEIAAELGMRPEAVRQNLHRARELLKRALLDRGAKNDD